MKVNINFTLDIDTEAWAREYGVKLAAADIRQDVKLHVENIAHADFDSKGLLKKDD